MKINALVISMTLPFTVNAMRAQETRSRWHTVQGTVVDEMEEPAAMATVSWIHPSTQSRGPHCGGIWSTTDPPCGTVYNLTLSTDPRQKYLLVADGTNNVV